MEVPFLVEIIPVIVVNWNEARLLGKACLKSLVDMNESCKKVGVKARVIIVDNGSSDTSFKVINDSVALSDSNVRFEAVWRDQGLGFVGSNNLGIKLGFEDPSVRFVATLNPDTMVSQDWLNKLFRFAKKTKKEEKIGMFASAINILKTEHEIKRTEEKFNYGHSYHQDGACWDIGLTESSKEEKLFCHCHAGSLLSREMLEECGLTDEDYFGWYDCPNQGWKARLKGWNSALVEGAQMWHRKSEARRRPDSKGIVERNRILTILRFMPLDKQPVAIGEYLSQRRRDGTTYEEKNRAIEEAHKLFSRVGQYQADASTRSKVYDEYCHPRI